MKIIVVEPLLQYNNTTDYTFSKKSEQTVVWTLADTALLTHGKPMFIPDYGDECRAQSCIAIRISRLGKSIPERFAARYYDAVTLGIRFELSDLRRKLSQRGVPWDIAANFDGAATIGDFEYRNDTKPQDVRLQLFVEDKPITNTLLSAINPTITCAVSCASKYYTIRQGDILLIPIGKESFQAIQNTHYRGVICDRQILAFNVK